MFNLSNKRNIIKKIIEENNNKINANIYIIKTKQKKFHLNRTANSNINSNINNDIFKNNILFNWIFNTKVVLKIVKA
jgi:hypothetical protein